MQVYIRANIWLYKQLKRAFGCAMNFLYLCFDIGSWRTSFEMALTRINTFHRVQSHLPASLTVHRIIKYHDVLQSLSYSYIFLFGFQFYRYIYIHIHIHMYTMIYMCIYCIKCMYIYLFLFNLFSHSLILKITRICSFPVATRLLHHQTSFTIMYI